jgi:hypothetical protein
MRNASIVKPLRTRVVEILESNAVIRARDCLNCGVVVDVRSVVRKEE